MDHKRHCWVQRYEHFFVPCDDEEREEREAKKLVLKNQKRNKCFISCSAVVMT